MRRDMDLVRLLLLRAEGEQAVDLLPYSEEQVNYHESMLYREGFIKGVPILGGSRILAPELVWKGHDFLDDIRDDRIWQATMKQVGQQVGSASLEVIKAVAASIATKLLTGG